MKRNLIYFLSVVMLLGLLPMNASAQAVQPTVMVMPEVNSAMKSDPMKLRAYLESNPMLELCVSRVKEMFTTRNFPIRDFATSLSEMTVNATISAATSAESSVMDDIAEASQADILIYVKPQVITHAGGLSEVILYLDAQEAKLSNSFANKSFASDKFATTDTVRLASKALDLIGNDFFYQIEEGFAQMVKEGLQMKFRLQFEKELDIDAFTEVGNDGNDLLGEIDAYAGEHRGKVTIGSEKLIEFFIRVPVYDEDGSNHSIGTDRSKMQRTINAWLSPLGYRVKTIMTRGQAINFKIQEKAN